MVAGAASFHQERAGHASVIDEQLGCVWAFGAVGGSAEAGGARRVALRGNVDVGLVVSVIRNAFIVD